MVEAAAVQLTPQPLQAVAAARAAARVVAEANHQTNF